MPRICTYLLLSLAISGSAAAQVFEISGGNSSLYQAGGGNITVQAPSYELALGAGTLGGHVQVGGKLIKQIGSTKYAVGDDQIDFRLPTDLFNVSHYLFARGVTMKKVEGKSDMLAFVGETTTLFESPLFTGAQGQHPAAFFEFRKEIAPRWQLYSDSVITDRTTQIAALEWQPSKKTGMAISAGVGANQPYFAGSFTTSRRWLDIQSSYVAAGSEFHRVAVTSPMQAEPDRGNVLASFKPTSWLNFSAGDQHFLVPVYPSGRNSQSAVDQAGASLRVAGVQMSGTAYRSSYNGTSDDALAFTASREITRRLRVMSSYLVSRPKQSSGTDTFLTTFEEVVNSHISVNESVDVSNGQTSVLFGGTLTSNLLSISANYETFYVPARTTDPFQESLVMDISLRIGGRLRLHGASFVNPTGRLMYTADGGQVFTRDLPESHVSSGVSLVVNVLRGQVIDTANRPVEGASVLVDGKSVFTDSHGVFFLREKKAQLHALTIATDQFLTGGQWEVVSAPRTIQSGREDMSTPVTVVVRQKPDPATLETRPAATIASPDRQ